MNTELQGKAVINLVPFFELSAPDSRKYARYIPVWA